MELKTYDKSETQKDNLCVVIGDYKFNKSREHLLKKYTRKQIQRFGFNIFLG